MCLSLEWKSYTCCNQPGTAEKNLATIGPRAGTQNTFQLTLHSVNGMSDIWWPTRATHIFKIGQQKLEFTHENQIYTCGKLNVDLRKVNFIYARKVKFIPAETSRCMMRYLSCLKARNQI